MPRIYAKVSIEMWGDERFTQLSPMPASGQSLWIYLLTGRFRTSVPGLNLNVGIGALSDRLRWSVRDVERCWREIEQQRMAKADWKFGVVWLPKGIEHNEPESPNVIKGWGKIVLPESPLVVEAIATLRQYLSLHRSKAYRKAFREAFREYCRQGTRNQEQEQDQEQDLVPPPNPLLAEEGASLKPPTRQERKFAEELRSQRSRNHQPACPHNPPCEIPVICIGRIVQEKRLFEASGQQRALQPQEMH